MNNLNLCRLSAVSKGGAVYKWLAKNIHLQDSDWLLIKKKWNYSIVNDIIDYIPY